MCTPTVRKRKGKEKKRKNFLDSSSDSLANKQKKMDEKVLYDPSLLLLLQSFFDILQVYVHPSQVSIP